VSFRPPFGKLNFVSLLCAVLGRRRMAFWDIDPRDYQQETAAAVAEFVIPRLGPGRVVLLHDGRRGRGKRADVTVEALRLILESDAGRATRWATVSAALRAKTEPHGEERT
jgi:hypothetical protein